MNKPEFLEITYKNKVDGSLSTLWLTSYTSRFFYCPSDTHIRCYYCGKGGDYFIFIQDRNKEFGFMACADCLQYPMEKIKDPISYPILFFKDI